MNADASFCSCSEQIIQDFKYIGLSDSSVFLKKLFLLTGCVGNNHQIILKLQKTLLLATVHTFTGQEQYSLCYLASISCMQFLAESLRLLRNPDHYEFLKNSGCTQVDGMDDRENFQITKVCIFFKNSSFVGRRSVRCYVMLASITCSKSK